jgi:eukaryotic translation initiation factor 2C
LDILGKRNIRDLVLDESDPPYRKLESFLRKVNVKILLPGHADRRRAIRGLVSRAGQFQFSKDGTVLTVEVRAYLADPFPAVLDEDVIYFQDHFAQAYNTSIRFPSIIGIVTSPRYAENPVVYPAEICQVLPGQFFKKQIPDEVQAKTILEFATMRPSQRLNLIKKGIDGRSGAKCPTPVGSFVRRVSFRLCSHPGLFRLWSMPSQKLCRTRE